MTDAMPLCPLKDVHRPLVMGRWLAHRVVVLEHCRRYITDNQLCAVEVFKTYTQRFLDRADLCWMNCCFANQAVGDVEF